MCLPVEFASVDGGAVGAIVGGGCNDTRVVGGTGREIDGGATGATTLVAGDGWI